jgi:hypothetical protein
MLDGANEDVVTISAQTRKLLWSRAHNLCSFASCWQALTADQVDAKSGEEFSVVVGEEAHIRSVAPADHATTRIIQPMRSTSTKI